MKTYLLLALLFSTASQANTAKMFVYLTPGGSLEAVSEKIKGNLIRRNGNFSADKLWITIESFKTGIDLRDEHLWKHLNYTKFPNAILTNVVGKAGKATGTLEINGIKQPVNMTYVETSSDITTTFKVKPSEFGLPKASYLGVGVSDEVKIEATYPFVSK